MLQSAQTRHVRRFAPLGEGTQNEHDAPKLQGIVFDVDGTLWFVDVLHAYVDEELISSHSLPQNYMFKEMRSALDIPKSVDILDHIRSLSDQPDQPSSQTQASDATDTSPSETLLSNTTFNSTPTATSPRARAVSIIQAIERRAMTQQRPQPGLQELMTYLSDKGIRKALCTRNFPAPVHHLLNNYLPGQHFDPIITRDTEGVEPKPSPQGLWKIAESWDFLNENTSDAKNGGNDPLELARQYLGAGLIMVGDSIDDMTSGRRAGATTVLLVNEENENLADHENTDLTVKRLDELIDVLEKGFASRG